MLLALQMCCISIETGSEIPTSEISITSVVYMNLLPVKKSTFILVEKFAAIMNKGEVYNGIPGRHVPPSQQSLATICSGKFT
jgi:hypothetical protein